MKTEQEWLDESEPAMPLAPALTESIVRAIQADALEHATMLLTAHADSQQAGFNAVYRAMLKLKPSTSNDQAELPTQRKETWATEQTKTAERVSSSANC